MATLIEELTEARELIASAAYSIRRGTFAAGLWLFDADKWVERANKTLIRAAPTSEEKTNV